MSASFATVRLRDIADLVGIQIDPREQPHSLYIGLEHVASSRFVKIGGGLAADVQSSKFAFKKGDVLYGKLRPYLDKAVLAEQAGVCTTELLVLRARDGVDPRFLICVVHCREFIEHAIAGTTGAQHPRTSWHRISEFEFPAFSSDEQSKIADIIWASHNAVLACEEAISIGEQLTRTAMRDIFRQGLRDEGAKSTEIGLVPKSWQIGKLGNFASFQRGFDITKSDQSDGQIPVVSSGGIRSYHNKAGAEGPGVVIGRKGSIGRLHYIETDYWPHDTTLWCKDFHENIPKFVFYRLHALDLRKLDSGAANPALNRNFLHDEMISWPIVEEQCEIVEILDAIERRIGLHRLKRAVLEELFKGLLDKLMTREIRVADLDLASLGHPSLQEEVAA